MPESLSFLFQSMLWLFNQLKNSKSMRNPWLSNQIPKAVGWGFSERDPSPNVFQRDHWSECVQVGAARLGTRRRTGEIDSCFLEELRCFKSVVYHARTPYINKVSIEGWLQAKSFQSDIPNMSTDPGPKRLLKKSLWLRRKRPTSPRP